MLKKTSKSAAEAYPEGLDANRLGWLRTGYLFLHDRMVN